MKCQSTVVVVLIAIAGSGAAEDEERSYLTTQTSITLFSTNDGEVNQLFQLTDEQTTDWELKTKDSFTIIHLGPDHPPIIRTIYDTVPCSILGTPTMAVSLRQACLNVASDRASLLFPFLETANASTQAK